MFHTNVKTVIGITASENPIVMSRLPVNPQSMNEAAVQKCQPLHRQLGAIGVLFLTIPAQVGHFYQ
jgi:hypothetical protein